MKRKRTEVQVKQTAPNPVQIQKLLKGIDYPVDKDDLMEQANKNGADDTVLVALSALPEGMYDSPTEVSRELTNIRQH